MADLLARPPYSYRQDPAVPGFPDDKPLFVFDGVCVLCSGGAGWLMRHDRRDLFRFASAQSPLGEALYRHYGLALDDTYILIADGRAYGKSAGYLRMLDILGGVWGVAKVFYLVPAGLRDAVYDMVARNRYRWFGKVGYCALIPDAMRAKLLSS
jgi:predicted DCC family thiol-disulfide oxidoreductase YuxK